jgi:hypothetical protein
LCGAAGSAAETASAIHGDDKQLMAAQEDDPWEIGPAMRDWPAVQEKRRRCAARLVTDLAMQDWPALQEERRRCAARLCESGLAMKDYPILQYR